MLNKSFSLPENVWKNTHCVFATVDNRKTRINLQKCCLRSQLNLIVPGTQGETGFVHVSSPKITQSYPMNPDLTNTIASCFIHGYPEKIEHVIAWAKIKLEQCLKQRSKLMLNVDSVFKEWFQSELSSVPLDDPSWDSKRFKPSPIPAEGDLYHKFVTSYNLMFEEGYTSYDKNNLRQADFLVACTTARCANYSIPTKDSLSIKKLALAIIPAMVTTTAVVSAVSCIQMIQVCLHLVLIII